MNGNRVTTQRVPYLHIEFEADPKLTREQQAAVLNGIKEQIESFIAPGDLRRLVVSKVRNAHPTSTKQRKEYKPKAGRS